MGPDFSRPPCVTLASGQPRCQRKCVTGSKIFLNGATLYPGHRLTGMRMLFLRNSIVFHHGNFERLRRQLAGLLFLRVPVPRDCVCSVPHPSTPPGPAWPVAGREEGRTTVMGVGMTLSGWFHFSRHCLQGLAGLGASLRPVCAGQ